MNGGVSPNSYSEEGIRLGNSFVRQYPLNSLITDLFELITSTQKFTNVKVKIESL